MLNLIIERKKLKQRIVSYTNGMKLILGEDQYKIYSEIRANIAIHQLLGEIIREYETSPIVQRETLTAVIGLYPELSDDLINKVVDNTVPEAIKKLSDNVTDLKLQNDLLLNENKETIELLEEARGQASFEEMSRKIRANSTFGLIYN